MTKSWEFLRNFRRIIPEKFGGISWGKIPKKFSGISRDYDSFSVPQKIHKISDQVQRISHEFPKKYSGEILRNFLRNSAKLCLLCSFSKNLKKTKSLNYDLQKISKMEDFNSMDFLENFRGIIHKNLFSRNSPEILSKQATKIPYLCYLSKVYT